MHIPTLQTQRLSIRQFDLSDLDTLYQILDVELEGNTSEQALLDRQQWLEWSVRNYAALERLHQPPYGDRAIVLRSSGELIGACGLAPVLLPFAQIPALRPADVPPSTPVRNTSEIGLYWAISSRYQRRGYATEAGAALIRFAFAELGLQRIVATTTYDNTASIGVMRKLGMSIEHNPLPEPIFMQVVGVLENR